MKIQTNFAILKQTRWSEYGVRFLFGGIITATTGIIASLWGPAVGGLFLAFPAILPATATVIEKHERDKKHKHGMHGTQRGRVAASIDAAGAAIGSIGLLAFALVMWRCAESLPSWAVLSFATVVWWGVSVLGWEIRKHT
jgi:hypothetical protein